MSLARNGGFMDDLADFLNVECGLKLNESEKLSKAICTDYGINSFDNIDRIRVKKYRHFIDDDCIKIIEEKLFDRSRYHLGNLSSSEINQLLNNCELTNIKFRCAMPGSVLRLIESTAELNDVLDNSELLPSVTVKALLLKIQEWNELGVQRCCLDDFLSTAQSNIPITDSPITAPSASNINISHPTIVNRSSNIISHEVSSASRRERGRVSSSVKGAAHHTNRTQYYPPAVSDDESTLVTCNAVKRDFASFLRDSPSVDEYLSDDHLSEENMLKCESIVSPSLDGSAPPRDIIDLVFDSDVFSESGEKESCGSVGSEEVDFASLGIAEEQEEFGKFDDCDDKEGTPDEDKHRSKRARRRKAHADRIETKTTAQLTSTELQGVLSALNSGDLSVEQFLSQHSAAAASLPALLNQTEDTKQLFTAIDVLTLLRTGRGPAASAFFDSHGVAIVLNVCRRILPQSCQGASKLRQNALKLVLLVVSSLKYNKELLQAGIVSQIIATYGIAGMRATTSAQSVLVLAWLHRGPNLPAAEDTNRTLEFVQSTLPGLLTSNDYRLPYQLCDLVRTIATHCTQLLVANEKVLKLMVQLLHKSSSIYIASVVVDTLAAVAKNSLEDCGKLLSEHTTLVDRIATITRKSNKASSYCPLSSLLRIVRALGSSAEHLQVAIDTKILCAALTLCKDSQLTDEQAKLAVKCVMAFTANGSYDQTTYLVDVGAFDAISRALELWPTSSTVVHQTLKILETLLRLDRCNASEECLRLRQQMSRDAGVKRRLLEVPEKVLQRAKARLEAGNH